MKLVVQLVSDFSDYQEKHPNGTLDDFYQYQHAKGELPQDADLKSKGKVMDESGSILLKLVTRISASFSIYMRIALKDSKLSSIDQFAFLAALNLLGETNKTEVTNYAMMEMSTGADILNRLLKSGYIAQRDDSEDKRSKLIRITKEGKDILKESFANNVLIRDFMLKDLTEDDKKLCIQLLAPIEEIHSKLSISSKQKSLKHILSENI